MDTRLHYRFPVLQLGLAVTLGTEAAPPLAIPGRLIDLSAGGCYLAALSDLGLTPGSTCRVGLPVTPGGLTPYPATVVRIERRGSTQPGVVLGLCFRHRPPRAQRQLLCWLVTLRVQTWNAALHGWPDPMDQPDIWSALAAADSAESAPMSMESERAGAGFTPDAVPPARRAPRRADPPHFVVLEESAEPSPLAPPPRQQFTPPDGFIRL